jgi:hypothetical protein
MALGMIDGIALGFTVEGQTALAQTSPSQLQHDTNRQKSSVGAVAQSMHRGEAPNMMKPHSGAARQSSSESLSEPQAFGDDVGLVVGIAST